MASIGDLMSAMSAWLRSTQLPEFSLWLQKTPPSMLIDKNFWFIPTFQTIHILSIAALFGSVVMMNLRIFMLAGRSRTMTQTVRRYLPWVWWALVILLLTGLGMVVGEPVRELTNPAFWTKMVLVIVAALLSLGFQSSVHRNVALWEVTHARRVGIRLAAVGVIILWCVIMVLGRWIAYAPT
jgi:uncharacterized membrane protein SirB2